MRNDDEDEDEKTPAAPKDGGPSAMLIQKKFLEQRKIFLWGAVEDASARDIVEKLLRVEELVVGDPLLRSDEAKTPRSDVGHEHGLPRGAHLSRAGDA